MKKSSVVIFGMAIALALAVSPAALAKNPSTPAGTTINVNTTGDVVSDDHLCSLREAVAAANNNAPSGSTNGECPAGSSSATDQIVLTPGRYNVSLGEIDILSDLNIIGNQAATLDGSGNGTSPVFSIASPAGNVGVSGLTITNEGGGGCCGGSAIYNNTGALTVSDSTFLNNATDGAGGAILSSSGILDIIRSTFTQNSARVGGAIENSDGIVNITDSTFTNNSASPFGGGAIDNFEGIMTITGSTLTNNETDGDGGAIYNDGNADLHRTGNAPLTIKRTTISNNFASLDGGGIFNTGGGVVTLRGAHIRNNDPNNCSPAIKGCRN